MYPHYEREGRHEVFLQSELASQREAEVRDTETETEIQAEPEPER